MHLCASSAGLSLREAIQALANQRSGSRQGNPNPTYYSLAATEYGSTGDPSCSSMLGNGVAASCIFYDVTLGDMDVNCTGTQNCYQPSGTGVRPAMGSVDDCFDTLCARASSPPSNADCSATAGSRPWPRQ
jgi:hypothetical protein